MGSFFGRNRRTWLGYKQGSTGSRP